MDKKITPKEAAMAVLKKAEEMLKSSQLAKAEKGVHTANHEGPGRSPAGSFASAAVKGNTSLPKDKLNQAAKEQHKAKLAELKAMPKPNLTKDEGSQMAKADEDRSKMSGKTGMVRGTTEASQNQRGVNQLGNNGSSGGMSEAGNAVRNAKHSSGTTKAKYEGHAIAHHKDTLATIKAMPKPNLTKAIPEHTMAAPEGVIPEPDAAAPHGSQNPAPQKKGVHKLAHFMGVREEKRKPKEHAPVAPQPEQTDHTGNPIVAKSGNDKARADKAVEGAKQPDHAPVAPGTPKKTVADLIKEKAGK